MISDERCVLVAGGGGALGSEICVRLRARGVPVRAIVREGTPPERQERLAAVGVEAVVAELRQPESLSRAVEGARCVVSTATCFPRDSAPGAIDHIDRQGNIALIDAAEDAAVSRFVFVSFKPVPFDFSLQRAKRAVEARLGEAALDGVVLRAGKFMDVWFSPLCGFDVAAAHATVFGDGTSPVTWIAAADVAEIAARAALGEGPGRPIVELGGPQALSQLEVIEIYEALTGRPWTVERIAAEELERRRVEAHDDVTESLAALMLEAHLGSTSDTGRQQRDFPIQLTTVRDFAARELRRISG